MGGKGVFGGHKIKIEQALYDRLKDIADKGGYSSVDEFVKNILEKEVAKFDDVDDDAALQERLRGLGYIE